MKSIIWLILILVSQITYSDTRSMISSLNQYIVLYQFPEHDSFLKSQIDHVSKMNQLLKLICQDSASFDFCMHGLFALKAELNGLSAIIANPQPEYKQMADEDRGQIHWYLSTYLNK